MNLTDGYYYEESGSQEQYSHEPTNDLNVARLLLNKPAWKKPDGALVKKKKTLIIYAPKAAQWDHFQSIIAGERLLSLKKQGFKIYVHQNSKFNELNLNALQKPKQLFEQKPLAQKLLIQQAAQQLNLSHDGLFVLNDEELQVLMEGDEEDYVAYAAADEINLAGSNLNISSLNKLLQSRASSITSLNLSGCLNLYQDSISNDLELPHLKELILENTMQDILIFDNCRERRMTRLNAESIDRLIASSEQLTHLNLSYCPSINPYILRLIKNPEHLEELHLAGCSFNKDAFTEFFLKTNNIKTLDLSDSPMDARLFKKLLKRNGNLKQLNLSGCKHLSKLAFYNLDLPHLEELNLNHTDIDTCVLSSFLENASKLKKLDLSECKNLSNTIYGTFPLDCLEEFDLSNSRIQLESLEKLLKSTKHLKQLRLREVNLESYFKEDITETLDLELLEELDLTGTNISDASLSKIIAKAKNLKKISCSNRLSEKTLKQLNYDLLEEINVRDNPQIIGFLKNTQSLKKLGLNYFASFPKKIPETLNLDALTTLDLFGSTIGADALVQLLKKAKNLKILDLRFCTILLENNDEELILGALEELNLTSTKINTSLLTKLLKNARNLKTLNLNFSGNHSEEIDEELNFESLETLYLSFSNLSTSSVKKIIKNARNLKLLSLHDCGMLSDDVFETLNPDSLEELHVVKLPLNKHVLQFLKTARNLKKIYLIDCDVLEESPEALNLASLEILSLKKSKISGFSLGKFLKNAKNLKKIDLSECDNLHEELPEPLHLELLEELDLSSSNISSASLGKLLKNAKNLKKIDLVFCNKLSEELPEPLNLESLEALDLRLSNISSASLEKLLKNAKNLKIIDLGFCKNLFEEFLEPLNLESLEKLDLGRSNISSTSLGKLLKNAKNLKIIDLGFCINISEELPEPLNLESLEELDLRNSNISSGSLVKLLKNAKNLKKIGLGFCINISEELPEPLNLESLEELDLRNSNISSASLVTLLKNAKNLKKLNLSDCANLFDLDQFTEGLILPQLESINVGYTTFDKKALQKIKAKPNLIIQGADLIKAATAAPTTSPTNNKKSNTNQTASTLSTARPTSSQKNTPPVISTTQAKKAPLSKKKLDAETTFSAIDYALSRLFYGIGPNPDPEVGAYRQQVFNQLILNPNPCGPLDAFELSHRSQDLQLESCPIEACTEDTYSRYAAQLAAIQSTDAYYYSKQNLTVGPQWRAVTSLSAHEQMLHYHVNPASTIELRYSRRDNLYYVRTPSPQTISLDFIVKVAQQDTFKLQNMLAPDIQRKIKECQNFGIDALKTVSGTPLTGADYLKALATQKVGACRHRMTVLTAWMQQNHPDIPVRCVLNKCHAFIEIQHNNEWIRCDLGGYPSTLSTDDSFRPALLRKEAFQDTPHKSQTSSPTSKTTPTPASKKNPEPIYFPQAQTETIPPNARAYLHNLLNYKAKRQLIEVDNASVLAALRFGLQDYCHTPPVVDAANPEPSRPCYYIDSPEDLDLLCADTCLQLEGTEGVLKEDSYGRLHQWLTTNKGQKPLLLINYSYFKPSDIARFHLLLEDNGPLPEEVQLIGLMNQDNPEVYDGVDFYSRFDQKPTPCPLPAEAFPNPAPLPALKTTAEETYVLDFFGGSRWEEQVYGAWILQGERLSFRKSELQAAFAAKKTIEWRNAPWHDAHFVRFWQEAQLYGYVQTPYETIELPKETRFIQSNGYDWPQLTQELTAHREQAPPNALVLNPSTLAYFFSRYECNATEHTLTLKAGILETHAQKPLSVYLSAPLPLHIWARLLDSCRHHQIALHIHTAFGVSLPREFPNHDQRVQLKPPALKPWVPAASITQDFAISSTDIDATVHSIQADLVLDVSELDPSDLLQRIAPQLNQKPLTFRFSEEKGALIQAVAQGKKVLLKGHFSPAMNDALNEFLYTRQGSGASGQVILISANPEIKFVAHFQHVVDAHEKQRLIAAQNPSPQVLNYFAAHECYQKQAVAPLNAMVRQHRMHPENSDLMQTWAGMQQLPPSQPQKFSKEDLIHAQEQAERVDKERLNAIETVLVHAPFVFIAGKTAVGKTTFLQQVWKKHHPHLHIGEKSLKDWACNTQKGLKVLFLDEANLTSRQWSEFESLLTDPPGIMIGNQYYPLTSEHKVIFAGNPLSYGGERTLPALFARHGHSVIFQPLPPAYLYHQLIAPVFTAANLDARTLAVPILEIADFLAQCNLQHVLISARELTMMALLTVSYCSRYPKAQPLDVVRYCAYHLSHSLVPPEALSAFSARWKKPPPLPQTQEKSLKHFHMNTTNTTALMRLNEVLELRALRQKQSNHSLDGGLGGIILEGEPGIGKSDLVVQCLAAHQLHKASLESKHNQENSFYHIPVSMALAPKKALLLRAFHEGAVVVIDEINCAPLMEDLLNDLLIGKTPEGEPPQKPGFMLIGTQNPSHMAGRRRMSPALLRRLHTVVMPPYSPEEMRSILILRGLPQPKAAAMVDEYLKRAQSPNHPPLCFRDLIKRAKHELINLNLISPVESGLNAQPIPSESAPTEEAVSESIAAKNRVSSTQALSITQESPYTHATDQAFKTKSSAVSPLREQFKIQLEHYINRIKITQNSDFSYGFWFFKQSRAMNRQVNYKLAQELLEQLNQEQPMNETLTHIEQHRMNLIKENGLNEKDNHGINSDELLKIIETAKKYIKEQQQEKETSCSCLW